MKKDKDITMKYWLEYKAAIESYDDKEWDELTESEFVEICKAQGDWAADIYFILLSGPSLVIRNKS